MCEQKEEKKNGGKRDKDVIEERKKERKEGRKKERKKC